MIKQFVSSEFNYYSRMTWLNQFKDAMDIREQNPNQAFYQLLDTDFTRWKLICETIDDIKEVGKAIEFLNTQDSVFDYLREQIEKTIIVAKLASMERREKNAAERMDYIRGEVQKLEQEMLTQKVSLLSGLQSLRNFLSSTSYTLIENHLGRLQGELEDDQMNLTRPMDRQFPKKKLKLISNIDYWVRYMLDNELIRDTAIIRDTAKNVLRELSSMGIMIEEIKRHATETHVLWFALKKQLYRPYLGTFLSWASEELRNDKDIVMVAVTQNGEALEYASEELRNDKDIVMAAMEQNWRALRYASDELRNDREVVLAAVAYNIRALQYASDTFKKDKRHRQLMYLWAREGRGRR